MDRFGDQLCEGCAILPLCKWTNKFTTTKFIRTMDNILRCNDVDDGLESRRLNVSFTFMIRRHRLDGRSLVRSPYISIDPS